MTQKTVLADYLTYAGPCQWMDEGWQIAFNFGAVQASIVRTPATHGIELTVWGLFTPEPQTTCYMTPARAVELLLRLMPKVSDVDVSDFVEAEVSYE